MIFRRTFVRNGALAAAQIVLEGSGRSRTVPAPTAFRKQLGLQLYSLQRQAKKDLPGTLRAIAAIGYGTIELPGFLGFPHRHLLDAIGIAGLRCDTCHVWPNPDPGDPGQEDDVGQTARALTDLGISRIVMPFIHLPARLRPRGRDEAFTPFLRRVLGQLTTEDWLNNAAWMNSRAASFKRHGIAFSYHNHNLEFAPVGGTRGLDLLLAETDPELVSFELDVGWSAAAGVDPALLLAHHPGRFTMMHVKDVGTQVATNYVGLQAPAPLGSGVIDWPRLLPVAISAGVRRFYVEQETLGKAPSLEDVAQSFRYLAMLSWQEGA